jgi:hypothetical protein
MRTYDLAALWPDSTPAQRVAAFRQILQATRAVLSHTPARLTAALPAELRATGVAAFLGGVGAQLGWWIETGQLETNEPLESLLREHLAQGRARVAMLRQHLASVLAAFARNGVTPVLIKGSHTAYQYFEDPGARPSGDIDLWIAPADGSRVAVALESLGLRRKPGDTMPLREEWNPVPNVPLESLEMMGVARPWGVDVHYSLNRRYAPGLIAGLGTPEPWQLQDWDGGPARVLTQPFLTAYLAIHASADFPDLQLMRVIELVRVLQADLISGKLRWSSLMELLRQTGTCGFAYPAFAFAEWLLPHTVDPAFLAAIATQATPRLRNSLPQSFTIPPYHFVPRSLRHRLAWSSGPRQVARVIAEWLYPTGAGIGLATRVRVWRRRLGLLLRGRFTWPVSAGTRDP